MEPPLKRPRLYQSSPPLRFDDAQALREKLKNRFEEIFEKYERNFSGVGDEIDLETGEIVVNNGHLAHMRDEQDVSGMHQLHAEIEPEVRDDVLWSDECFSLSEKVNDFWRGSSARIEENVSSSPIAAPTEPIWKVPDIPGLSTVSLPAVKLSSHVQASDNISERSVSPNRSLWAVEERCRARKWLWTGDDDKLLRRLRTTARYSFRELEDFFPGRNSWTIRSRWEAIKGQGRSFSSPVHHSRPRNRPETQHASSNHPTSLKGQHNHSALSSSPLRASKVRPKMRSSPATRDMELDELQLDPLRGTTPSRQCHQAPNQRSSPPAKAVALVDIKSRYQQASELKTTSGFDSQTLLSSVEKQKETRHETQSTRIPTSEPPYTKVRNDYHELNSPQARHEQSEAMLPSSCERNKHTYTTSLSQIPQKNSNQEYRRVVGRRSSFKKNADATRIAMADTEEVHENSKSEVACANIAPNKNEEDQRLSLKRQRGSKTQNASCPTSTDNIPSELSQPQLVPTVHTNKAQSGKGGSGSATRPQTTMTSKVARASLNTPTRPLTPKFRQVKASLNPSSGHAEGLRDHQSPSTPLLSLMDEMLVPNSSSKSQERMESPATTLEVGARSILPRTEAKTIKGCRHRLGSSPLAFCLRCQSDDEE